MSSATTAPGQDAASNACSTATTRLACAVSVVTGAVLLYLVNSDPGWTALPFLTSAAEPVMDWLSVALMVAVLSSLASIVTDRPWVKPAAQLAAAVIGGLVLAMLWRVFPFDYESADGFWSGLTRIGLAAALLGTGVMAVVDGVNLVRRLGLTTG